MKLKKLLALLAAVCFLTGVLSACGSAGGEQEAVQEPESAEEVFDPAVVATTAGQVRGTETEGAYQFLGIPYAEAKELFVPAEAVTPWEGVRDADTYGVMSPQAGILGMGGGNAGEGTSNNCQNLNIWTPAIGDGAKRPVMVWLHGGGFSSGTANEPGVNGANMSRAGDAVVVGVNHRLNVFGFLNLSSYGEKYRDSANTGVMDIVAVLQWIHDNIAAFGGDPDNVTIFGQSGGGAKVLAMMSTPYAAGLFHKGINQSGATETMGPVFFTEEQSELIGAKTMEKLGLDADSMEEIQFMEPQAILDAAGAAIQEAAEELRYPATIGDGYSMEWEPTVDGDFLPTDPVTADGFAESGRDIPLLIGSNLNEWSTFMSDALAYADMSEEARAAYAEAYPNEDPETAPFVDTLLRLPLLKIMSHKAAQGGAPVYAYVFTKQGPQMGSYHGAEIPYVFHNADDAALSNTMTAVWTNFARNGVPSADGLEEWTPYERENGATMILDDTSYLAHKHDEKLMNLLAPDYFWWPD